MVPSQIWHIPVPQMPVLELVLFFDVVNNDKVKASNLAAAHLTLGSSPLRLWLRLRCRCSEDPASGSARDKAAWTLLKPGSRSLSELWPSWSDDQSTEEDPSLVKWSPECACVWRQRKREQEESELGPTKPQRHDYGGAAHGTGVRVCEQWDGWNKPGRPQVTLKKFHLYKLFY